MVLLDKGVVVFWDEVVVSCLDEGVLACLDDNNKDNFDVFIRQILDDYY